VKVRATLPMDQIELQRQKSRWKECSEGSLLMCWVSAGDHDIAPGYDHIQPAPYGAALRCTARRCSCYVTPRNTWPAQAKTCARPDRLQDRAHAPTSPPPPGRPRPRTTKLSRARYAFFDWNKAVRVSRSIPNAPANTTTKPLPAEFLQRSRILLNVRPQALPRLQTRSPMRIWPDWEDG